MLLRADFLDDGGRINAPQASASVPSTFIEAVKNAEAKASPAPVRSEAYFSRGKSAIAKTGIASTRKRLGCRSNDYDFWDAKFLISLASWLASSSLVFKISITSCLLAKKISVLW